MYEMAEAWLIFIIASGGAEGGPLLCDHSLDLRSTDSIAATCPLATPIHGTEYKAPHSLSYRALGKNPAWVFSHGISKHFVTMIPRMHTMQRMLKTGFGDHSIYRFVDLFCITIPLFVVYGTGGNAGKM